MPLGRFRSVPVDIAGVSTLANFEVIEIIDDSNPYPALLGIEWAIDNDAVINLKTRQMTFEGKGLSHSTIGPFSRRKVHRAS